MESRKLFCLAVISAFLSVSILGLVGATNLSEPDSIFPEFNQINKIGPNLQDLLANTNNHERSPLQIIILFQDRTAMDDGLQKLQLLSPEIHCIKEWRIFSSALFETPVELTHQIVQLPEVLSIWLNKQFSISNFDGTEPGGSQISQIISPASDVPLTTKNSRNYSATYNGTNVIVALLDTGVDIFHPDLNRSILAFGGVSMVEGDPFPLDFHGHGTFCAGLITGDGLTNDTYRGVAPGADILNIKVLSYLGIGLWSWIISGIEYAIVHGADIIAMCFSMPGYPNDPVDLAIKEAIARGMLVITAAGDDGPAYSSITAPGMAQGAITVGAFNDQTSQPALFSSRGPTLSFHIKPDLLASGVNIISCRPSLPSNLPINLTELFQGITNYGVPIDDDYTMVNSTSAAAANVTGMVASLLQHSKFLSNEEAKIILQHTACELPDIPFNVQGAGLANISAAHSYLLHHGLNYSLDKPRLYTPTLLSPGYVVSLNSSRNITAFTTGYGSILAIIEGWQNEIFTHLIQGQLAIQYNDQLKWLSDMYLLRELHNLTPDFSTMQSVITDYSVLCVFCVEAWPSINAFRVNLTIVNLAPSSLDNLSVISLWETDLFSNQSIPFSNDLCEYNAADDILYVNDKNNGNNSYIGFTGKVPSSSREINTSAAIRTQLQADSLLNNDASADNLSIAMQWNLTSQLDIKDHIQFSQYIGIGGSYQTMNQSIQSIKSIAFFENFTNIALLSSNLSRLGLVNQPYTSQILAINLGNTPVNDTFAAYLVNSTDDQTQTFFSKYIQLGRLEPFEFKWVTASWNPTEEDIYSVYWIVGTETLISEIVLYLLGLTEQITTETDFLDNFFIRNIFIKEVKMAMHKLFPNIVPIAPQLVYFPNDVAIFNLSLVTNHPLINLDISTLTGNLPSEWISYQFPSSIQNYGSIQITIAIPQIPPTGAFYALLNVSSEAAHIGEIWVNFSISYPSGRILFYKPSVTLSFQGAFEISDLYTLWNERLDTIYGDYFDFFNLSVLQNYDVDDFGILKQIGANLSLDTEISLPFELPYQISTLNQSYSYLSNYDLVIICDPDVNLSQPEVDALIEFGHAGGSLFFWLEPEDECEHASINSILALYGIQISNSYNFTSNQPFLIPGQHSVSEGLTEIEFETFVTFQNSSAQTILTQYISEASTLLNDSTNKLLCTGDSTLFATSGLLQADNLPFLNNSLNWLLEDKINITVIINQQNASEPLRINEHLSISIHLTTYNGTELSNNLTLFTFLITPSNRTLYMPFFHVQAGWYNTLYLDSWLNETGVYLLGIYANSPAEVTQYAITTLTLATAAPPADEDPSIDQKWASVRRVFFGMMIAIFITTVLVSLFLYQRLQWRRQMSIVELKEKLQREISNLLSEYQLYISEIDALIKKPEIIDPDKLRMVLDMQDRKKELLKTLKKLGKKV